MKWFMKKSIFAAFCFAIASLSQTELMGMYEPARLENFPVAGGIDDGTVFRIAHEESFDFNGNTISSACVNNTGEIFAIAHENTILVKNISGQEDKSFYVQHKIHSMAFYPEDNNYLIVSYEDNSSIQILNIDTNEFQVVTEDPISACGRSSISGPHCLDFIDSKLLRLSHSQGDLGTINIREKLGIASSAAEIQRNPARFSLHSYTGSITGPRSETPDSLDFLSIIPLDSNKHRFRYKLFGKYHLKKFSFNHTAMIAISYDGETSMSKVVVLRRT